MKDYTQFEAFEFITRKLNEKKVPFSKGEFELYPVEVLNEGNLITNGYWIMEFKNDEYEYEITLENLTENISIQKSKRKNRFLKRMMELIRKLK